MQRIFYQLFFVFAFLFSSQLSAQYTYESLPSPGGGGGIPDAMVKAGSRLFKTTFNLADYSDDNGLSWHSCPITPGIVGYGPDISETGRFYIAQWEKYYFSDDLGVTWDSIPWEYNVFGPLNRILPVSNDTLIGITGSMAVKSTDGGLNWDIAFPLSFFQSYWNIEMIKVPNSQVILINFAESGGFYYYNQIFKSYNNGETWDAVLSGAPTQRGKISCSDNGTLFLNGVNNQYWRSDDEGTNWLPLNMSDDSLLQSIYIFSIGPTSTNRVWGSTQAGIYVSEDDGLTWEKTNAAYNNFVGNGMRYIYRSGAGLFASSIAEWGGLYRSTDNGDTWDFASNGLKKGNFRGLVFNKETELILYNEDGLFKTTNNGQSWDHIFKMSEPSWKPWNVLKGKDQYLLVSFWNEAHLSADGGLSWTKLADFPEPANVTKMNPYNNNIYIRNSTGKFYVSTDLGASWKLINMSSPITDIFFFPDGSTEVLIHSTILDKDYIYTLDDDLTLGDLRGQRPEGADGPINIGYNDFRCIIDQDKIYRSDNHGSTWTDVPSPFSALFPQYSVNVNINVHNHIFFYYTGDNKFYSSLDNGATWNDLQAPATSYWSPNCYLSPEGRLYFLGYQGIFYRTATPTSIKAPSENTPGMVRIAPNPFSESVLFEFLANDIPAASQLLIYDVTGICVAASQIDMVPYVFNAKELLAGMYFYQIHTPEGKTISGKIEKVAKR